MATVYNRKKAAVIPSRFAKGERVIHEGVVHEVDVAENGLVTLNCLSGRYLFIIAEEKDVKKLGE